MNGAQGGEQPPYGLRTYTNGLRAHEQNHSTVARNQDTHERLSGAVVPSVWEIMGQPLPLALSDKDLQDRAFVAVTHLATRRSILALPLALSDKDLYERRAGRRAAALWIKDLQERPARARAEVFCLPAEPEFA